MVALVILAACSPDASGQLADADHRDAVVDASGARDAGDNRDDVGREGDGGRPEPDVAPDSATDGAPDSATDAGLTSGWYDRAPMPRAQQETAVVALDGRVWVLGGFNQLEQQIAWTNVYDPQTDRWEQRQDFPVRAHHMNATVYDGKIWVTGFLGEQFDADRRTFVYDPEADAWDTGPDLPIGRQRGAAATGLIDGKIYVAGGVDRSDALPYFDVLDPTTGEWTALPDVPRDVDHAAFGVIDGALVVAGGRNALVDAISDQVNVFDPDAGQWTSGAPLPTARGGAASAVVDGKLYVFGGDGNSSPDAMGVFDHVEAYDLAGDRWETLEPMPVPRHGLGAAAVDGIIYLPGGGTAAFVAPTGLHQIYVP
jgi:N-acetylneuraminic acid mutarotase